MKMRRCISARTSYMIGVTGNICSGKSYILKIFSNFGFRTFSMDDYISNHLYQDKIVIKGLLASFPQIFDDGVISKRNIFDLMLHHPDIFQDFKNHIYSYTYRKLIKLKVETKKQNSRALVVEHPLLFEQNREGEYDMVILLKTSLTTMKERAKRRNIDSKKLNFLLGFQHNFKDTYKRANYLIYNENRLHSLLAVKDFLNNARFNRSCA